MPGACRNNELQFAGTYGDTGVRYTLTLPEGDTDVRSRQVRWSGFQRTCTARKACRRS